MNAKWILGILLIVQIITAGNAHAARNHTQTDIFSQVQLSTQNAGTANTRSAPATSSASGITAFGSYFGSTVQQIILQVQQSIQQLMQHIQQIIQQIQQQNNGSGSSSGSTSSGGSSIGSSTGSSSG